MTDRSDSIHSLFNGNIIEVNTYICPGKNFPKTECKADFILFSAIPTNNIIGGECGSIGLTCAGTTKAVPIVSMVAIGMFVPSWQSIHINTLCRETNTHVSIASYKETKQTVTSNLVDMPSPMRKSCRNLLHYLTFRNYFNFEIIYAT